jgi:hypothetical protein
VSYYFYATVAELRLQPPRVNKNRESGNVKPAKHDKRFNSKIQTIPSAALHSLLICNPCSGSGAICRDLIFVLT